MFVHDTWAARDLPVLDATVSLLEQSYMVTVTDIAASTGLDEAAVAKALDALDPVYVDFRKTTTGGDPRFWYVFKVTPEARRAVGQWPTAEGLAGRLAEELAAAARQETDAERQGLLAYAARLVGDTLRDATVRAAAKVLSPAFGGVPQPELGSPVPEPVARPADSFESLVPLPELPELLRPAEWSKRDPAMPPDTASPGTASPGAASPGAGPESGGPDSGDRAPSSPGSGGPEANGPLAGDPAPASPAASGPEATGPGPASPAAGSPAARSPVANGPDSGDRAPSSPGSGGPDSSDTDLDLIRPGPDAAAAS